MNISETAIPSFLLCGLRVLRVFTAEFKIIVVAPPTMKPRYRPIVRSARGATYYCFDTYTKRRTSLKTADRHEAARILNAKNEAAIQPMLNLQIARAYLFGSDDHIAKRTWRDAILALTETKLGSNKERWQRAQKEKAFAPLWSRPLVETKGEELLAVLRKGGVSTNQHLRRLHNFRVDMNWLPWPLVPKRQWPAIRHKEKRAITWEEHCRIVAREGNAEQEGLLPAGRASGRIPGRFGEPPCRGRGLDERHHHLLMSA